MNFLPISLFNDFYLLKKELQKIIEELDNAIAKENYQIIEDMDLDSFYSYTDSSKESLEKLLNYFKKLSFQNSSYSSLYHLLDEIYTLFLQLEDRISTLESYKDIAKFKKVS